jgi:hypothetical protein
LPTGGGTSRGPDGGCHAYASRGNENGTFFGLADQFANGGTCGSSCTGFGVLGQSNSRQNANNRYNDHQLNEGEALLKRAFLLAELLEELQLHAMLQIRLHDPEGLFTTVIMARKDVNANSATPQGSL